VLSPSASLIAEAPQEEETADPLAEEVPQEVPQEDTPQEEETADLPTEDLQDVEDQGPETTTAAAATAAATTTTTSRNQMSAASFPRPTFMYPTSHSPSMRRSLENTLRITKSTS